MESESDSSISRGVDFIKWVLGSSLDILDCLLLWEDKDKGLVVTSSMSPLSLGGCGWVLVLLVDSGRGRGWWADGGEPLLAVVVLPREPFGDPSCL